MPYVPFREALGNMEISRGDILMVTSDITRLMMLQKTNEKSLDTNPLIDALQTLVGEEGTLLFPTYNWNFCKGQPFDYYKTPSQTGFFSKVALQRKDFKRTRHPIYSFAVWGKYKDFLCSLENIESFGSDSPFDFLYKQHGKNLIIDVKSVFTFKLYVEESVGVPYRYIKNFTALYTDELSNCSEKTYSMYVRNLEMDADSDVQLYMDDLKCEGIAKENMINGVSFLMVDLYRAFDVLRNDILYNRSRKIASYKGQ
ncbi:aminoglycoside 3'-phosphotransferase [Spirochaetia bacterium]|nr:aminoglycoside 3'-phosphotransferase [Spirochaetia bacterium]